MEPQNRGRAASGNHEVQWGAKQKRWAREDAFGRVSMGDTGSMLFFSNRSTSMRIIVDAATSLLISRSQATTEQHDPASLSHRHEMAMWTGEQMAIRTAQAGKSTPYTPCAPRYKSRYQPICYGGTHAMNECRFEGRVFEPMATTNWGMQSRQIDGGAGGSGRFE